MSTSRAAALAYASASHHRSLREQEADVFRRAGAVLRWAPAAGDIAQARAVADNDRLWTMVLGLVRDPGNALPPPLRAALASIGIAVQKELRSGSPDTNFVATVNETVAAGLASAATARGERPTAPATTAP